MNYQLSSGNKLCYMIIISLVVWLVPPVPTRSESGPVPSQGEERGKLQSKPLLADAETSGIAQQWRFDSTNAMKSFRVMSRDTGQVSMAMTTENNLLISHHRGPVAAGILGGNVQCELPANFIFRVNIVTQHVEGGGFYLFLRGTRDQGACQWRLDVPRGWQGTNTLDLHCQAPAGRYDLSLYVNATVPSVEGVLGLISVSLIMETATNTCEWSSCQRLANPGFEETWAYPGSLNATPPNWVLSETGVYHRSEGTMAAAGRRYLEMQRGYIRQRVIVHYPERYLIGFYASGTGRVSIIVREDGGTSADLLRVKSVGAPDLSKPLSTSTNAPCVSPPRWQRFYALYPVLTSSSKSGYIEIDGADVLLDEVEMYPVCPDPARLARPIADTQRALSRLLAEHPGRFEREAALFEAARQSFETRGRTYPDDYLRQITRLIQKIRLNLLLE